MRSARWVGAAVYSASQPSPSSRALGNGLWFRTPGLFGLDSDPEHSDASIQPALGPIPTAPAFSFQLVCSLGKAVQFH